MRKKLQARFRDLLISFSNSSQNLQVTSSWFTERIKSWLKKTEKSCDNIKLDYNNYHTGNCNDHDGNYNDCNKNDYDCDQNDNDYDNDCDNDCD